MKPWRCRGCGHRTVEQFDPHPMNGCDLEISVYDPPTTEALKIGDRVPMPERKLNIRPAFTGPGKTSFKPARKDKR